MKLYNLPHSPYAARVRLQIAERGLNVELTDPPGGLGSDQYKATVINGKVPALEHAGNVLAESTAILEFLEDYFPENPLRPQDPWQAAQERAAIRYIDLEFAKVLFPFFQQLSAKPRDEAVVTAALKDLDVQLAQLEKWYLQCEVSASSATTLLDCAAIPVLFYVVTLAPLFGKADVLTATPVLEKRWAWSQENSASRQVTDDMAAGLKAMMGGR